DGRNDLSALSVCTGSVSREHRARYWAQPGRSLFTGTLLGCSAYRISSVRVWSSVSDRASVHTRDSWRATLKSSPAGDCAWLGRQFRKDRRNVRGIEPNPRPYSKSDSVI